MIKIRRSEERGHADLGWLNAYQTFSFGGYQDPLHNGFRVLRVLNDDRVAPGKGFGPHAHRDMEIITYVVEGHILHRDSTGEQHVVGPNEIQTMSAGSGVVHSEFNASENELCRVMQIWIDPQAEDLSPSYQQIAFNPEDKRGKFRLLAGPETSSGEQFTRIHQDARLYVAEMRPEETVTHSLAAHRQGWLQVVKGNISLNGQSMKEGDGAALSEEGQLIIQGNPSGGEVLFFDLP